MWRKAGGMRRWAWAMIIAGAIIVAVAWRVWANSGPRYDSEGLPTGPVGVTYVTHVPEYRLAYPGARILSVTDQGEIRYGGWLQVNTISPATSTVRSEAPARQQQVLAWHSQWLTRHGWTRCTRCRTLVQPPEVEAYFTHGLRRAFSVDIDQDSPGKYVNLPQARVGVNVTTAEFVRPYSPHLAPLGQS